MPPGFTAVTPFLTVNDPDAMLAFAKAAFGAEELKDQRGTHDGKTQHLAFRVEGCIVEIGIAHGQWKGLTSAIHLYVPDVEAAYERAVNAGSVSLHEVQGMDYGERAAAVQDPFGNQWYIATYTGHGKK
jgi:uncharacterized glyoxalase superfamily protein PhnB